MLALGAKIDGGKIIGDYGSLERKDLQDRRDLRVEVDFRSVFGEALKGVHGFDAMREKNFFPVFSGREPLGLCKA